MVSSVLECFVCCFYLCLYGCGVRGRSIRCGYLRRWVGSRSLPLSHLFAHIIHYWFHTPHLWVENKLFVSQGFNKWNEEVILEFATRCSANHFTFSFSTWESDVSVVSSYLCEIAHCREWYPTSNDSCCSKCRLMGSTERHLLRRLRSLQGSQNFALE